MKRAVFYVSLTVAAIAGCRSPSPTVSPLIPYGPQTVPPPVTGSIGTPTGQAGAPYYQSSQRTTVSPQSGGWHPPSTSLNSQSLAQSQPAATNPSLNATTTVAGSGTPNANFTSTGGQTFNAPQVTNPATIQSNGSNVGGMPANNAVLGSGMRSAQAQPWQPAGATNGAPQLLNTGAAPTGQQNGWGQQPNPNLAPQPNNGWGQPQLNNGSQIQTAPNGIPLNGMPVNNGTYAYGQPTSAWSMEGVKNWFQTTFGQPVYGVPQGYATQQGYATPQPNGYQPAYQTQVVPASGYSTTAPTPTPLPVRGTQSNVAPASYQLQQQGAVQAAPTAPAAVQWGSVPMASASGTATVRGNDDTKVSASGFVTSHQASPTPHDAELYGNHQQYLWLRGQLEFSQTQRRWKLRYIPLDAAEGRIDSFGGSVELEATEQLEEFQSGDFVMVKGELKRADSEKLDPIYLVQEISKL